MNFTNLKAQLPPVGAQILINIGEDYYVGKLDNVGVIEAKGLAPIGIYTTDIFWCLITKA